MEKVALRELLAAASDGVDGSTFTFSDKQEAALLVAVDGTLLTVTRVRRVTLAEHHLVVEADREILYVEGTTVAGVRLKAAPSGAGFLNKG